MGRLPKSTEPPAEAKVEATETEVPPLPGMSFLGVKCVLSISKATIYTLVVLALCIG